MIHNMFNEDLLTRCRKLNYQGQHIDSVPPPMIINEEEEYEVEEVRKHRKQEQGTQYLVHWKGYGNKHNQWIAEMGLPCIRKVIEEY